jgi:hypothetical protein
MSSLPKTPVPTTPPFDDEDVTPEMLVTLKTNSSMLDWTWEAVTEKLKTAAALNKRTAFFRCRSQASPEEVLSHPLAKKLRAQGFKVLYEPKEERTCMGETVSPWPAGLRVTW